MKRFLKFNFSVYYPEGGWNDLDGDFDTMEQALEGDICEQCHIIDLQTGKVYDIDYVEGNRIIKEREGKWKN